MLIAFLGSQHPMTDYQQDELRVFLKLKGCSEFMTTDLVGAEEQAASIAMSEGVKLFTIYPVEDNRKRAFFLDPRKISDHIRIITPYTDAMEGVKIKWYPIDSYMKQSEAMINAAAIVFAAPKEHKLTYHSATWKRIQYAWKIKKEIIIIPPINRSNPED